jgi:transcriptional regulator with XRE-family HTH domain
MTLENLGKRIRWFRKALKLSQAALAAVLHVARQTISNWERGRAALSADIVPDLCRALKISPNELYGVVVPVLRATSRQGNGLAHAWR